MLQTINNDATGTVSSIKCENVAKQMNLKWVLKGIVFNIEQEKFKITDTVEFNQPL